MLSCMQNRLTFVDWKAKWNFHESSVFQIFTDKVLDDTCNTDTDAGKIDQKIHVRNIDGIFDDDLIFL